MTTPSLTIRSLNESDVKRVEAAVDKATKDIERLSEILTDRNLEWENPLPENGQLLTESCRALEELREKQAEVLEEIRAAETAVGTQKAKVDEKEKALEARERELQALQHKLDAQKRELDAQKRELDAQKRELDAQKRELDAQKRELDAQKKEQEHKKVQLDERESGLEARASEIGQDGVNHRSEVVAHAIRVGEFRKTEDAFGIERRNWESQKTATDNKLQEQRLAMDTEKINNEKALGVRRAALDKAEQELKTRQIGFENGLEARKAEVEKGLEARKAEVENGLEARKAEVAQELETKEAEAKQKRKTKKAEMVDKLKTKQAEGEREIKEQQATLDKMQATAYTAGEDVARREVGLEDREKQVKQREEADIERIVAAVATLTEKLPTLSQASTDVSTLAETLESTQRKANALESSLKDRVTDLEKQEEKLQKQSSNMDGLSVKLSKINLDSISKGLDDISGQLQSISADVLKEVATAGTQAIGQIDLVKDAQNYNLMLLDKELDNILKKVQDRRRSPAESEGDEESGSDPISHGSSNEPGLEHEASEVREPEDIASLKRKHPTQHSLKMVKSGRDAQGGRPPTASSEETRSSSAGALGAARGSDRPRSPFSAGHLSATEEQDPGHGQEQEEGEDEGEGEGEAGAEARGEAGAGDSSSQADQQARWWSSTKDVPPRVKDLWRSLEFTQPETWTDSQVTIFRDLLTKYTDKDDKRVWPARNFEHCTREQGKADAQRADGKSGDRFEVCWLSKTMGNKSTFANVDHVCTDCAKPTAKQRICIRVTESSAEGKKYLVTRRT